MSDRKPAVSIGVPVYNGENFLADALDSILAQTFGDFELLISDNASTDGTAEICREYARRDPRVRYHRNEVNVGGVDNINQVFGRATGRYFKWAAHDDRIAPTFLEDGIAMLEENPDAVLAFSGIAVIDGDGRVTKSLAEQLPAAGASRPVDRFREIACTSHGGFHLWGVMRADVLEKTGLHGRFQGGDRVLLAEMALHGPFATIPGRQFLLRDHEDRGTKAYPSIYRRAAWHDPSGRGSRVFPHWRIGRELLAVVGRAPLDRRERIRCYLVMARWPTCIWNWARLAMDLLVAVVPGAWRVFEWARARAKDRRLARVGRQAS